jgi:hypothetical protein
MLARRKPSSKRYSKVRGLWHRLFQEADPPGASKRFAEGMKRHLGTTTTVGLLENVELPVFDVINASEY